MKVSLILFFGTAIDVLTGCKIAAYLNNDKEAEMINCVKGEEISGYPESDKHIIDEILKMSNQKVLSNRGVHQNESRVY